MTDEEPLTMIARARRRAITIPRNADVMAVCDLAERYVTSAAPVAPPPPPRNVTCPVCEAHRKANAARVRKHRQRLPEPKDAA
jgi:hypothetical protein